MKRRDSIIVPLANAILHLASREYRTRLHRAIADGLAYQLGVSANKDRPNRP